MLTFAGSYAMHFGLIPTLIGLPSTAFVFVSITDTVFLPKSVTYTLPFLGSNCNARNMSVIRQQKNLKRWKHSLSYGQRWMAETVFSSIKITFGEYVTARKFQNMANELILKASLYNMFATMM
ncbi:MAG: transposase [Nitrososphaeraceae archaeon]